MPSSAPHVGPGDPARFINESGESQLSRIGPFLSKSDDGGSTWSAVGTTNQVQASLATLYTLTGIDPQRSQNLIHNFDTLAGWVDESTGATGQSGANSLVTAAEYDEGQSFIQLAGGGLNTIMRGFLTNIGGTFTQRIPTPGLLDQVTPVGFAMKFQVPADSGSYILGGFSLPTSGGTGTSPDGVYVGFLHNLSVPAFCGYKQLGGVFDSTLSTVQLDGAWHVGYVWSDGSGNYFSRIDNEKPIAMPNVNAIFTGTLACVRIAFATANPRVAWCTAIWPGVG
jgi:hypothetical protein